MFLTRTKKNGYRRERKSMNVKGKKRVVVNGNDKEWLLKRKKTNGC